MGNSNDSKLTYRIFDSLINGQQSEKTKAQASLSDPNVDQSRLRILILDALSRRFYPREDPNEDKEAIWNRMWLLSTLGRISNDDPEAQKVVRNHLYPEEEPDLWARFWALEGLVAAKASDLEDLARKISEREREPAVRMLAVAILASKGDSESMREIQNGLLNTQSDTHLYKGTVRALRIVPIMSAVKGLCAVINKEGFSDVIDEAIIALGQLPSAPSYAESPLYYAEIATETLKNFIKKKRTYEFWDGVRTHALSALGNLRVESIAPLLIEELIDDNPAIVREAAKALEKVLGIRTATARILEAGSKYPDLTKKFADALRWMDRASVVEELETAMVSGHAEQQETARSLLSEVGGTAAFQKLHARTEAMAQYSQLMEKAEEKIRNLFETTIQEARGSYKWATYMDLTVFFLGVVLIAVSAYLVQSKGGTLDSWAGIGLTGGGGLLGIIYGTLIAKPRSQIQESVDHLMYIKVIFLAYLRQLHQADQAYSRRMLEDNPLTHQELDEFSKRIEKTLLVTIEELRKNRPEEIKNNG